jgi:hypothetical protein
MKTEVDPSEGKEQGRTVPEIPPDYLDPKGAQFRIFFPGKHQDPYLPLPFKKLGEEVTSYIPRRSRHQNFQIAGQYFRASHMKSYGNDISILDQVVLALQP